MSVTTCNSKFEELEQKRIQLKTRRRMLQMAWDEMEQCIAGVISEIEVKQKSIKLSKTVQAELLGISRGHFYNMGFHTKTYAELWAEVKHRRPDLLERLEENFNEYIKK